MRWGSVKAEYIIFNWGGGGGGGEYNWQVFKSLPFKADTLSTGARKQSHTRSSNDQGEQGEGGKNSLRYYGNPCLNADAAKGFFLFFCCWFFFCFFFVYMMLPTHSCTDHCIVLSSSHVVLFTHYVCCYPWCFIFHLTIYESHHENFNLFHHAMKSSVHFYKSWKLDILTGRFTYHYPIYFSLSFSCQHHCHKNLTAMQNILSKSHCKTSLPCKTYWANLIVYSTTQSLLDFLVHCTCLSSWIIKGCVECVNISWKYTWSLQSMTLR